MHNKTREALADYAHQAWSGWMEYMFGKLERRDDGALIIPAGYVAALQRLIDTPYADLDEAQKDNDRAEADRMLAIVAASHPLLSAARAWAATHPPEGCAVCEALRAAVGDVSL